LLLKVSMMKRMYHKGTAAVEFALALPFILLVLAAIVDFGRAYSLRVTLTNAAREGARYAAEAPTNYAEIQARVNEELQGSNIGSIAPENIEISTPEGVGAGKPVYVTVRYRWRPFLGSILGLGEQWLRVRASMAILPD